MSSRISEEDVDRASEKIILAGEPVHSAIDVLKTAANSSRDALSTFAGEVLGYLSEKVEGVTPVLLELSESRKKNGRFASLKALNHSNDRSLSRSIVEKCLHDRSAQIREYAAYVAVSKGMTELAPILDRAIEMEKREATREALRFNRGLLVDGYFVGDGIEEGEVEVTVKVPGNGPISSVSSFINKEELDRVGLERFVADKIKECSE